MLSVKITRWSRKRLIDLWARIESEESHRFLVRKIVNAMRSEKEVLSLSAPGASSKSRVWTWLSGNWDAWSKLPEASSSNTCSNKVHHHLLPINLPYSSSHTFEPLRTFKLVKMDTLVAQYSKPMFEKEYNQEDQMELYEQSIPSLSLRFAMPPVAHVCISSSLGSSGASIASGVPYFRQRPSANCCPLPAFRMASSCHWWPRQPKLPH